MLSMAAFFFAHTLAPHQLANGQPRHIRLTRTA